VALPPCQAPQPVSKLHLIRATLVMRPQTEPTNERSTGLLNRRPDAKAVIALVVAQEARQDLQLHQLAWRRDTTVEVAHHLGIAIQLDQVLHISLGEPAQDQSLRLQEYLHRSVLFAS